MTRSIERKRGIAHRSPLPPVQIGAGSAIDRRFRIILAGICLAGLVCRLAILIDYVGENPLAAAPINDAKTYWEWAGRIAGGELVQDTPFFSAPLYPYLLGLVRALGGTLTTVYVIQILMDLATAFILACTCRRRYGAGVGLLAAGLFLLLQEPVSFSLRILTCSLQLLLLAFVYRGLVDVADTPSIGRHVLTGAVIGLLCLSYPSAMVLAVAVGPWLFAQSPRQVRDGLRAAIPFGVAALLLAPATLHNWYASDGDVFLIQSVTAVNLRQGNQPESTGGYTRIPRTTLGREHLFEDVARLYEEDTGRPGSWADINRYHRGQVIRFWLSDPLRTVKLAGRKLYYFLSSRNYGDIYQPNAELACGLNRRLRLAPLPVPWLMGPALVGLVLMLRNPGRHAPEWIMFAIPLLLVTVFWYTPRYRLPAIPMMVTMAAWAIVSAWRPQARPWRGIAVLAALAGGILLGVFNRAVGFDRTDPAAMSFHLAYALNKQGKVEAAVAKQREGLDVKPGDPAARIFLGDLLNDLGRFDEALEEYDRARAITPDDTDLLQRIGKTLFQQQRYAEAEAMLTGAVDRRPADAVLLSMLAGVRHLRGDPGSAGELYERALGLAPENAEIRALYGDWLIRLQRWEDARAQLTTVVQSLPDHFEAHYGLGIVASHLGEHEQARDSFQRALELRPQSVEVLYSLGALHFNHGRWDEAGELFRRALAIDPANERCRRAWERVQQQRAAQSGGD